MDFMSGENFHDQSSSVNISNLSFVVFGITELQGIIVELEHEKILFTRSVRSKEISFDFLGDNLKIKIEWGSGN